MPPYRDEYDRFKEKYRVCEDTGCWNWTGAVNPSGYGEFKPYRKSPTNAHRWFYAFLNGPIPPELHCDHLCRNRKCVNPNHIEVVSQRENILRGVGATAINAAKTHCPKGHEFTPDNITKTKRGKRCRICKNEESRQRHANKNRGQI